MEGALAAKQEGAEGLRGVGVEMLTSEGLARQAQSVPSTLITGILHGCTGTGHLLGVMPALAMPSWLCASAYLTSFGLGTMIAMSLFTAVRPPPPAPGPDHPPTHPTPCSIFPFCGRWWARRRRR